MCEVLRCYLIKYKYLAINFKNLHMYYQKCLTEICLVDCDILCESCERFHVVPGRALGGTPSQ